MSRRHRDQRGAATTELVIATPLLLLLLMLIVQFALWQHANHVAQAAAQEGVRAARVQGGNAADGRARAQDFMAQLGSSVIVDPRVDVDQDAGVVRVAVHGTAENVVPFLRLPIDAVAQSSREVFTP